LDEALARFVNMTPEEAWALAVKAKWGFTAGDGDSPYEYDQEDQLVVWYDDLHNLASIAIEAMKLLGGPFEEEVP
jgi:hypothetical protein